jgi:hypothetical protein
MLDDHALVIACGSACAVDYAYVLQHQHLRIFLYKRLQRRRRLRAHRAGT